MGPNHRAAPLHGLCSPDSASQVAVRHPTASPDTHPLWGQGQGSDSSHAAVWDSLGWHQPLALLRPVISSDFDLMQQLLVMWFEADKCPLQPLSLTLLMMQEHF